MAIITISRGTFSGGRMLAECLCQTLGYRCIDRDVLVKRAARGRISAYDLQMALEEPPPVSARVNHTRYVYLALIEAALTEEARNGRLVYHGLAGHLLLKGVPGLLRLRIIAPLEFRIRLARERLKLDPAEATAHIEKMDRDRRKWTQFLYGLNWGDPDLYDLVINLEHLGVDAACRMVACHVSEAGSDPSAADRAKLSDRALASRVRAELALNPYTLNLEVQVEARNGAVTIRGTGSEEFGAIRGVARQVPGVAGITVTARAAGGR